MKLIREIIKVICHSDPICHSYALAVSQLATPPQAHQNIVDVPVLVYRFHMLTDGAST